MLPNLDQIETKDLNAWFRDTYVKCGDEIVYVSEVRSDRKFIVCSDLTDGDSAKRVDPTELEVWIPSSHFVNGYRDMALYLNKVAARQWSRSFRTSWYRADVPNVAEYRGQGLPLRIKTADNHLLWAVNNSEYLTYPETYERVQSLTQLSRAFAPHFAMYATKYAQQPLLARGPHTIGECFPDHVRLNSTVSFLAEELCQHTEVELYDYD